MSYNKRKTERSDLMNLADRVKQRREELGLSQEQLALRMGYNSRTSINKIENGRPCSQKIIARLADALYVSIPYLMGWEDEKEKPTIPEDDGLSEKRKALIDFAKTVPEDKADMILKVIQSIVESD
jgi:transcriptional regulator with XRE-family HTH domain